MRLLVLCLLVAVVFASEITKNSQQDFNFIDIATEDYAEGPVGPSNGVYGFSLEEHDYAVINVVNGLVILDTDNTTNPITVPFDYKGCITQFRDVVKYQNYLYVVNDRSPLCACFETNRECQQLLQIDYDNSTYQLKVELPFNEILLPDALIGEVVYLSDLGCMNSEYNPDLANKFALIDEGGCDFTTKITNAHLSGAEAALIILTQYESLNQIWSYNGTFEIPVAFMSSTQGTQLKSFLNGGANSTVLATLNKSNKAASSMYNPPDHFRILNISDINNIQEHILQLEFNFAKRIIIDPIRPWAYICGVDILGGGIMIYDITDPLVPSFIAVYSGYYIDNLVVVQKGQEYILYATAVNQNRVVIIDVTELNTYGDLNDQVITEIPIDNPSALAITEDTNFLFVSTTDVSSQIFVYSTLNRHNVFYLSSFSIITPVPQYDILELVIKGNSLWISASSAGILLYNIDDPSAPQFKTQFFTSTSENPSKGSWGVYPRDNGIVYAADFESGFWSLTVTEEEPSATSSFSPSAAPIPSFDSSYSPSTSYSPSPSASEGDGESGGLNYAEIAGIVIATVGSVLVLLCLVGVAALCIIRYRMRKTTTDLPQISPDDLEPEEDIAGF